MRMPEDTAFAPDEVWTPRSDEYGLDAPIQAAREVMNQKNTDSLVQSLKDKVRHSHGIAYAVLDGDYPDEYSKEEALVLFDTFSVGPSANRLVRAEFIREVARHSGVTDNQGKYKPVIFLASPGPGSTIRLSANQRKEVEGGELGIAAREMLRVVKEKDVGAVALLGFSQGGVMALAGARKAYHLGLDVRQVAAGDPTNSEERGPYSELRSDFWAASDFQPSIEATGLNAQRATLNKSDASRAVLGTFKPLNWRTLVKGLSRNTFEAQMQQIIDQGEVEKAIIGYGTRMAKAETMEPALSRLSALDINEIITSIKLEGVDHTWGDELPLLAKLYMRALS